MEATDQQAQAPEAVPSHEAAIAVLSSIANDVVEIERRLAQVVVPPVGRAGEELRLFAKLDRVGKRLEAAGKKAKGKAAELNDRVLAALEEVGLQNAPLAGGVTVYQERVLWAGNDADDEEDADAAYERACNALEEAGLGEYVQRRYNVQSLSGYFREEERRLEAEIRERDGLPPDQPVDVDPADLIPEPLQGVVKVSEVVKAKAKQS